MRSERALVVDDEPVSRAVLRHVLEVSGWEVEEASDGREGLEVARRSLPDLVLTDLRMPELSGRALAGRIREEPALSHVILIAVTRHPEEAKGPDGEGPFDLVLPKPLPAARLWDWLQSRD